LAKFIKRTTKLINSPSLFKPPTKSPLNDKKRAQKTIAYSNKKRRIINLDTGKEKATVKKAKKHLATATFLKTMKTVAIYLAYFKSLAYNLHLGLLPPVLNTHTFTTVVQFGG